MNNFCVERKRKLDMIHIMWGLFEFHFVKCVTSNSNRENQSFNTIPIRLVIVLKIFISTILYQLHYCYILCWGFSHYVFFIYKNWCTSSLSYISSSERHNQCLRLINSESLISFCC